MAKGQKKGNREAKKPKGTKKPGAAAAAKNQLTAAFATLKAAK